MVNRDSTTPTTNYYPPSTIFVVGPTASGKSGLAMQIAEKFDGEIVCADSQTIRRGLNIGTAKPSMEDQARVKHHILDIIEPYERYSAAQFKQDAEVAIADILARGKLAIVVGGTGLYIDSLLYGFDFRKDRSEYSREALESLSVNELQKIIDENSLPMPENKQNPRHLIRVIESGGQESKKGKIFPGAIVVGIDPGKEILDSRIKKRIQIMLDDGFLDEVDGVIEQYGNPPESFDAIGYKIALQNRASRGVYDEEKIKELFAISDRQYAKRQRGWFKRNSDIVWFDGPENALMYIEKQL